MEHVEKENVRRNKQTKFHQKMVNCVSSDYTWLNQLSAQHHPYHLLFEDHHSQTAAHL